MRIGHCISKLLPITSGVPQGSILGPLMFILYINDLPTVAMSNCFGYADVKQIFSDNAITLNIDSNKNWNWCSKNFMCLNLSKRKTLQFKGSMSVCMKKQNIPGTDLMKDLGLIVTNDLSLTEHAKTRSAKSLKAFFTLKRNLANSSTISTKKNAYRGYVVPIISYASSLWKPSKSKLVLTEKVQHRASIWILGTNNLSYISRLQRLHLLPLSLYHEMYVVLLFARIINSKTDIDWEKYVQIIDTGITRSHAIPFYTSKCFRLKKCESDFWHVHFQIY